MRERHHFHWRHRRVLIPLAALAAVLAAGLVLALMPMPARERGSVLAVAALAYFSRVHAEPERDGREPARLPLFPKELLVGLLFTAGCALPAWNRAQTHTPAFVAGAGYFALLAWLNCAAIDRWESADRRAGGILSAAALLAAVGCFAGWWAAATDLRVAALLVAGAAAALLLALLDAARGRMTALDLRAAADVVLLTPLALLLR